MLKSIPPTAMAPMYAAEPKCPTMVTSINPSKGTVMLEMIDGMAMRKICLLVEDNSIIGFII